MSEKTPDAWSELKVCPSCGAAVAGDAKACWLCNWDLAEEIVAAEVIGEAPGYVHESTSSQLALIAGIFTMGLVTVGVFAVAPGIGVLMGVLFVIATFAVTKSLKSDIPTGAESKAIAQAYSSPAAVTATAPGSVIVQVLRVLGVIILIAVASVIALFTFCVICVVVVSNV